MFIVDSQVHIWDADTPERPWRKGGKPHRAIPFGHEDLLEEMNAAGVSAAVLVPPSWEGERNDLCLKAVEQDPDRFAIMGRLNPQAPGARQMIASWRNSRGMLGLRFSFTSPTFRQLLISGEMEWVWAEAANAEMPLYVLVSHLMVPLVDVIAETHPRLKIVMDHMGIMPGKKDEEAFRDFDKLLSIAKRPNVAVKLTGLPNRSTDVYPYLKLHPYIRKAYDAFGPKRLFWGTDLTHSPITYRENITMFTEEMPWLSYEDKEWIMGKGITQWLGWDTTH